MNIASWCYINCFISANYVDFVNIHINQNSHTRHFVHIMASFGKYVFGKIPSPTLWLIVDIIVVITVL